MSTETEYLQRTPNMKNDEYLPCSCFILDKKGKSIRVHISKYMQNETEYCKIRLYFESALNNNSCVQKKVTFLVFLYWCHLTTLALKPLKRLYILQDNFCNSNPRIKRYHSLNEIDLVFYLHLYQITLL